MNPAPEWTLGSILYQKYLVSYHLNDNEIGISGTDILCNSFTEIYTYPDAVIIPNSTIDNSTVVIDIPKEPVKNVTLNQTEIEIEENAESSVSFWSVLGLDGKTDQEQNLLKSAYIIFMAMVLIMFLFLCRYCTKQKML